MKLRLVLIPLSLVALVFFTACDENDSVEPAAAPTDLSAFVPSTGPALTASPNHIPAGSGMGVTTIGWNTGGGVGQVYLTNGTDEKLFAQGDKGAQAAPWIMPGKTGFRLYRGTDRGEMFKEIWVTMDDATRPSLGASATPVVSPSP